MDGHCAAERSLSMFLSPSLMSLSSPVVIVLYVAFLLVGVFVLICALVLSSLLLSVLSGWSRLAKHYPSQVEFEGKNWHHQSGHVGLIGLRRALTIGSNTVGLFLAVPRFLRTGHPPLFIPWDDITVTKRETYRYFGIQFSFLRVPGTTLQITRELGDQLIAERNVLHYKKNEGNGYT
jgi:hypothetical protein